MDAKELMDRISQHQGELPRVRSVTEVYAEIVAAFAARLTPQEVNDMVALGALISKRSSRLVPVLKLDQIEEYLGQGRPIA